MTNQDTKQSLFILTVRIFRVLVIICLALLVLSTTFAVMRAIYVGTAIWGIVLGGWALLRVLLVRRWLWVPVVVCILVITAWVILAGRPPNTEALRAMYAGRLCSFTGVRYIWGGETHVGIDCSGLARIALCEAMILEGVRTGNPQLLGPQLWRFWWRDMSAQAMLTGAYGNTVPVDHAISLATFDHTGLLPGDLAVSDTGEHVLIYLGNRQWIEANPEDGKVVINTAVPSSRRGYFHSPKTVVRWQMLSERQ